MSKKNKRAKQAKKKPNAEVQSDTEAEEIVSELEEMVSPLPPKKSGAQRVEERAEEIKDAAARPTAVYGPEGEMAPQKPPPSGAVTPGADGQKRVTEEFLQKKSDAEQGGTDPVATPSGPSKPPLGAGRANRLRFGKPDGENPPEKQGPSAKEESPPSEKQSPAPPRAAPRSIPGGVSLPDARKAKRRLEGG